MHLRAIDLEIRVITDNATELAHLKLQRFDAEMLDKVVQDLLFILAIGIQSRHGIKATRIFTGHLRHIFVLEAVKAALQQHRHIDPILVHQLYTAFRRIAAVAHPHRDHLHLLTCRKANHAVSHRTAFPFCTERRKVLHQMHMRVNDHSLLPIPSLCRSTAGEGKARTQKP